MKMKNINRKERNNCSEKVSREIDYYFERYFEARNTWILNKEFWVVTLVGLLFAFVTFRWLYIFSIVIPILFSVYMWCRLGFRKPGEKKSKR
jgi:hypothetical protein